MVPVPPAPVYHVNTAPPPATPFAVTVVVAFAHIGLAAAVADVIAGIAVEPTVTDASTAGVQVPVTRA